MSVIKAISAPFRLAKWCVVGEKLECVESAKRIGKLLKAEKRVIQGVVDQIRTKTIFCL